MARSKSSLFRAAAGVELPFDVEAGMRTIANADPVMGALMQRVGPFALQLETMQDPFGSLAESIVYQQLTGKAAATIFSRVAAIYAPKRKLRPDAVLQTPDERLRAAGLSRAKTLALKDLAAKAIDGTVPSQADLLRMSDDEIVERLTEVRGIGRWTVEMMLVFRLGRPDVLPVHDYGVRKGFARTYRKRALPEPKKLAAFGERWRPWRTIASWYLWRAMELPAWP